MIRLKSVELIRLSKRLNCSNNMTLQLCLAYSKAVDEPIAPAPTTTTVDLLLAMITGWSGENEPEDV